MKIFRKPHRYKKREPIFRNKIFWLGIFFFLFAFFAFYFLFLSGNFLVKEVIITGEEKISKEQIQSFFPPKNIFFFNLGEVENEILNKFPQIAKIEIKRQFPNALNVIITERKPLAVFCQEEHCFFLDKEGVVFEDAFGAKPGLAQIRGLDLLDLKLGQKIIEGEQLSQILKIESELKSILEIPPKEFIISSEDKLIAVMNEGWEIYFNLQGDTEWQLTKLRAVWEEKIPPERRKDLEYIELRFGNFAPFKYRAFAE